MVGGGGRNFCVFFFLLDSFKKEKESKIERKETEL
jgi:hypothetical protein